MRFSAITMGLTALMFSLSACAGSSSGSAANNGGGIDAKSVGMQGVWIQKDEAEQLRATGKIDSICEEVKKDPNSSIMNVRLVEANGTTYIYNPQVGKIEQLKMGVITASGDFTPTPFFKDQIGNATVRVSVSGDVLSFGYKYGQSEIAMDYLRSTDTEARQYYAAQEACKK